MIIPETDTYPRLQPLADYDHIDLDRDLTPEEERAAIESYVSRGYEPPRCLDRRRDPERTPTH